ncbi:hypothetical protein BZU18_18860 [Salmonella enterica subsp. enterica serovar Shubra]|nr:hypothetical protein [Salmonella enterica subsp. enterica serovar Shubra]
MREEIKTYMQIKKCSTTRGVADAMGISVYQAQYYLAKLQEKAIVLNVKIMEQHDGTIHSILRSF